MSNLNFLFVMQKETRDKEQHGFPYGLAYVTAVMKERGFHPHYLDLNFASNESVETRLRKKIISDEINVVCLGGMSVQFDGINEVLEITKRINPKIITVVGGAIITAHPQLSIENMQIDYGVTKEGEYTMAELAETLCNGGDVSAVTGIVFKDKQGKFVSTGERKAIMELDTLPMPDYEGWEFERHVALMKPNASPFQMLDDVRLANIISSRSCPFSCTFCYQPLGRVYRQRSIENVFKEIDFLRENYGINAIGLMDDLFSIKEDRMLEFAARITPYHLLWTAQLRVGDVNLALLRTLKASGLMLISYGIESVNDDILISMKKKITSKQIEDALRTTREAKIGVTGNILIGDPAETEETFEISLEWWKKHPEYDLALYPILTIPNSRLYQLALKKGLIKDEFEYMKNKFPIINLTEIPDLKFSAILSKTNIYMADSRFKTRGKVIASHKTGCDKEGTNYYSITLQCPECQAIDIYNNFHQTNISPHFPVNCKRCLRRYRVSTLKAFPDNYSAWQKIKLNVAYGLKGLYLRNPRLRFYAEKIPFVTSIIKRVRDIALDADRR